LGERGVEATALTYKIDANEKACFYAWVDNVGEKLAFYFAVDPNTPYCPLPPFFSRGYAGCVCI